jgi:acyl-CoA dehydrogenase
MGPEEHGGHCEIEFDGLEIPDDARLMNVGDGLKVTQIRLGTARLTHCMRWLGLAKRSLSIALEYVTVRESHGRPLASLDSVQSLLGEAAMQIEIGRLLTMRAAAKLDQGDFARKEISMAKVASPTLHRARAPASSSAARGYPGDTVLEWIYRARQSAACRRVIAQGRAGRVPRGRRLTRSGAGTAGGLRQRPRRAARAARSSP